ncbi:alpha,alpha-trehalase TreF [Flavimarina sp. Hel_I_48]|uniref:alpha,alpha-trehalase TreF n=1 Tax=Flavimarina sp. Hel_I_48 TaxID=1392488 RepID=UPI00056821C9|nr:alpha,alpha-trehalase TreF [Flavimarina sp. Hel_I_48]
MIKNRDYIFFLIITCTLLAVCSCKKEAKNHTLQITKSQEAQFLKKELNPIERYEELLVDVQMQRIFEDGKTFVDCIPKFPADTILKNYRAEKERADFDLKTFVLINFELPISPTTDFESDTTRTVSEHIETLWPYLTRNADEIVPGSRIALPNKYIVPGGRFQEVYYWDSYFILLGLKETGNDSLLKNIVDNFAYQIAKFGFVPNGNRTYYLSRSQPPFFAEMVELLASVQNEKETYLKYKDALEHEYAFWMKGARTLAPGDSKMRVVKMKDGSVLNRFYSNTTTPRAESYYEDVTTAAKIPERDAEDVYLNISAACESGWDFSSRWFSEPDKLTTIKTTRIIPADLNALIFKMEKTLAKMRSFAGDERGANNMETAAEIRKKAINTYLWDAKTRIYQDYDLDKNTFTNVLSLATVYPLYFGLASQEQADSIAEILQEKFLSPGGLSTTLNDNSEQWDYPNGWPPLQWISIRGLERYGKNELATTIKSRWLALNEDVYKRTGKMLEKYNVVDTSLLAGGGEYPNQDGFGWTNGVYLDLKEN